MRVTFPSGSRNYPFDRNPSTVGSGPAVSANVGGTGTTYGSYTVPATRRATVGASGSIVVSTALAAGQTAYARLEFTPSGGALQILAFRETIGTAVGTLTQFDVAALQMKAGDKLEVRVDVGAGAGAAIGSGGIQGQEYDA